MSRSEEELFGYIISTEYGVDDKDITDPCGILRGRTVLWVLGAGKFRPPIADCRVPVASFKSYMLPVVPHIRFCL
jgi:hypothetical protein